MGSHREPLGQFHGGSLAVAVEAYLRRPKGTVISSSGSHAPVQGNPWHGDVCCLEDQLGMPADSVLPEYVLFQRPGIVGKRIIQGHGNASRDMWMLC